MNKYSNMRNISDKLLLKIYTVCFSGLVLMLITIIFSPVMAQEDNNVLVLNSYHAGYDWTESIISGIRDSMSAKGGAVNFNYEYMDTKRLNDDEHFKNLHQLFAYKYKKNNFKAIIVTDNDAFKFVIAHRDELFPGTPVVFCGINFYNDDMLKGISGFTGVAETFEGSQTIDLILRLHPKTGKIIIIIDGTTTGLAIRRELEPSLSAYGNRVAFEFIQNDTLENIKKTVASSSKNSVILLMPFARDSEGTLIDYSQMAKMVSKYSPVPVYGTWDFYLGHGIVGGRLTDGHSQGFAAGNITRRVLDGENISNIDIQRKSPTKFMFDARQLRRFGISAGILPENSHILYQSWYDENKYYVWIFGLLAVLLLAAVWTLIVVQIKRKAAEAEVKKSDERFRTLIEKAPIPIAMAKDLKLVYCNSSFVKMYGYDNEEEIKGLLIDQMVAPEYRKTFLDRAKNRLSGLPLPVSYEAVGIRKNCQEFPLHITASILDLPDGSGLIGFFQDMSERKRMETELIQLANTDFLTDIPNRRHFMELASRELAHGVRYGNPLSMLMMDVDLFKQINDNYGHKTGDIVLIKLADLCRKTLREVDIVGRLGGEEFAILLPETTGACAFEVAERLRKAIHSMVVPLEQGELLRFTVSIGVTLLKGREESVETLINRADSAMYRAKQSGRNTVCMAADHKHE